MGYFSYIKRHYHMSMSDMRDTKELLPSKIVVTSQRIIFSLPTQQKTFSKTQIKLTLILTKVLTILNKY